MDRRFDYKIQKYINKRLQIKGTIRVLEIGFGEGKALLELRSLFPNKNIELYGINLKREGDMRKKTDFIANAKRFGITIKKSRLPTPFFYDAGYKLHFSSNFFDVIISQCAFHYIPNKAKLIEEIWRVLKLDGKAFLHIDSINNFESYPDFLRLNNETPHFLIYSKNRIVKLDRHLQTFRRKGYNIKVSSNPKHKPLQKNLLINKKMTTDLKLNLEMDTTSSFNLMKINGSDKFKTGNNGWWGTRSVFRKKL